VVIYDHPVWQPLHTVSCGTWIDVPPVVVPAARSDLQLLAVRFVDAGHPEQKLGPRYRVWIRNNSDREVPGPFDVTVIAALDGPPVDGLPQAGVRVDGIGPAETQAVDVRLPFEVYDLGRDSLGRPAPFAMLHVIVDSHGEIDEASETNNGSIVAREEILPVDPAAFSTDVDVVVSGGLVSVAGEGLGPEPGQVLLYVQGLELDAEIHGWYDLGVRIKLPALPLAGAAEAQLVIVRGDGVASNPLPVTLVPSGTELLPSP
jgi:hypothetical protein